MLLALGALAASLAFLIGPIGIVILKIVAAIAIGVAFVALLKKFPMAFVAIGFALGAILGPIGWLITVVSLLVLHWDDFTEGLQLAWEWIRKVGNAIATLDFGKLGELFGITGSTDRLRDSKALGDQSTQAMMRMYGYGQRPSTTTVKFENLPKNTQIKTEGNVNIEDVDRGLAFGTTG